MNVVSKLIFILAFGFIFSSGVQAQIYFPEDLLIDPLSSEIKELKVKKIEQYTVWSNDSTQCNLKYVVIYDSIFNLKTIFYNGQRRGENYNYIDSENLLDFVGNSTLISDSLNIYSFNFRNQTKKLKFFRLNYTFDGDKFIKVEEKEPKAYSGPISIMGPLDSKTTNVKKYFDSNSLIKTEFFENDTLVYTETYFYEIFKTSEREIKLLIKKRVTYSETSFDDTYIKYYF